MEHRPSQPIEPGNRGETTADDVPFDVSRIGVYEREGEIYRAHQLPPDGRPALADFIVRRDSDGRYGGYIADLAQDDSREIFGAEDLRYEAYDDCGRYVASAASLRGALYVFAHGRLRWISDSMIEPEPEAGT